MTDTELPLSISCSDCAVSRNAVAGVRSDICDDCIVTFFCGADGRALGGRATSVVLTAAEARTVRLFQGADLAPQLRHSRHLDVVR